MKIFGCLCYVSIHSTDKFSSRAFPCIFIGYPFGKKGYKLYNLHTKTTLVSRHVIFHEHTFPYLNLNKHSPQSQYILPSTSVLVDDTSLTNFNFDLFKSSTHTLSTAPPLGSTVDSNIPSSLPYPGSNSDSNLDSTFHIPSSSSVPNPDSIPPVQPIIRQSTRLKQRPNWWTDYEVHTKPTSLFSTADAHSCQVPSSTYSISKYPISSYLSYQHFSPTHKAFITHLDASHEPSTYSQAVNNPKWVEAMTRELVALEENQTWTLMELPPGKRAIGCKWVYKNQV